MRILKWLGIVVGAAAVVLALLYLFRTDPVYTIAGKRLSGEERPYPGDWSQCAQHPTIAVETRPEAPHSVTTICVVLDGELIIPAREGGTKRWTANVVADPRIRVKIGDAVYPALAHRAHDIPMADFVAAARAKYPQMASGGDAEAPRDVWLFRVTPRIAEAG